MGWHDIKLDKADVCFSEYIRRRDKLCRRCGRSGYGHKGITGLQNSHYFSRRHENTRYDEFNCCAICPACHFYWGGDGREEYTAFMKGWLGQDGYKQLVVRNNTYCRKDRKLALMQAKLLLKTLD